jgi:hypothetical protein
MIKRHDIRPRKKRSALTAADRAAESDGDADEAAESEHITTAGER